MTKQTTQYGVWSGHKWIAGPLGLNQIKRWCLTHPEAAGYVIAAMENGDHRPLTIAEAAQFADCAQLQQKQGMDSHPSDGAHEGTQSRSVDRNGPNPPVDVEAVRDVAREIQARSRAQIGALSRKQRAHKLEGMQELVTLLSAAGVAVPAIVHGAIQSELERLQ